MLRALEPLAHRRAGATAGSPGRPDAQRTMSPAAPVGASPRGPAAGDGAGGQEGTWSTGVHRARSADPGGGLRGRHPAGLLSAAGSPRPAPGPMRPWPMPSSAMRVPDQRLGHQDSGLRLLGTALVGLADGSPSGPVAGLGDWLASGATAPPTCRTRSRCADPSDRRRTGGARRPCPPRPAVSPLRSSPSICLVVPSDPHRPASRRGGACRRGPARRGGPVLGRDTRLRLPTRS